MDKGISFGYAQEDIKCETEKRQEQALPYEKYPKGISQSSKSRVYRIADISRVCAYRIREADIPYAFRLADE